MLTSDWHIHSRNSCDCRKGKLMETMAEMVAAIEAGGILDYGITDHLHTPCNLPDVEASRREFDALPPNPRRHFGIEVSSVSRWELDEIAAGRHGSPEYGLRTGGPAGAAPAIALTAEDVARLKIEYVVGGTHWPLYAPMEREAVIRDYHRQNMHLACCELVTIVAHPWWWMGHWRDTDGMYRSEPWLDDFGKIPRSMHEEFAAAARQHGKVVEINLQAMLVTANYTDGFKRQYCQYLAWLRSAGVTLSVGSDHHAQHTRYGWNEAKDPAAIFLAAEAMLAGVGIRDADLWRLPG